MMVFLNVLTRFVVMGFAALLMGAGGAIMELESQAFQTGDIIPPKYTCDGQDISPPLSWSDPPDGTTSFALISDDPDAPMGTWVHWVIWNIPASARALEENTPQTASLPNGATQGTTDFHRVGYGGPCPPSGTHRYFFKLYALDTTLNLPSSTTKKDLEKAMHGHILAQTELMGKYRRR
jgi:Raf kinase inhibitor-like YbhB/YbcL family protein